MKRMLCDRSRIVGPSIGLIAIVLAAALAAADMHGAGDLPKDFRSWTHTKSMVIPDKSHGLYGFHHIYANDPALKTQKEGGTYQDGSSFVVSFYEVVTDGGATVAGKKIQDVLMVKNKKAAKTGGWFYAAFDPEGKAKKIDPVKACYECHLEGAKDTDFVFSKYVD